MDMPCNTLYNVGGWVAVELEKISVLVTGGVVNAVIMRWCKAGVWTEHANARHTPLLKGPHLHEPSPWVVGLGPLWGTRRWC